MRNDKESDNMVIKEDEIVELEEFGALLAQAFELSGEPPALAEIEYADASVSLPERSPAHVTAFNEGVRRRIGIELQQSTGSSTIGAWIQRVRQDVAVSEMTAARATGVSLPAYKQFEAGRMPVWRLPAESLAQFCKRLMLDATTLLRWASVSSVGGRHGVYGRLDLDDEARSLALESLGQYSEAESSREFDEWRRQFIAAYDQPSEDGAPARQ
jgi:hypothetical protein